MPKIRSSIPKENLCEAKMPGNYKGWLGDDHTKQFLITKIFRRGLWKYHLQIKDERKVRGAAIAPCFTIFVIYIDLILQRREAGNYAKSRSVGEFHLLDLAAAKEEGFSILRNPGEEVSVKISHTHTSSRYDFVQVQFSCEQKGILQGYVKEAANYPSCEQPMIVHKAAEDDPRFSVLLNKLGRDSFITKVRGIMVHLPCILACPVIVHSNYLTC